MLRQWKMVWIFMDKNHSPLDELNTLLERKTAQERVEFAVQSLPENYLLASSFGAQSAANLHLITQVVPNIPVVFLDTDNFLFYNIKTRSGSWSR